MNVAEPVANREGAVGRGVAHPAVEELVPTFGPGMGDDTRASATTASSRDNFRTASAAPCQLNAPRSGGCCDTYTLVWVLWWPACTPRL